MNKIVKFVKGTVNYVTDIMLLASFFVTAKILGLLSHIVIILVKIADTIRRTGLSRIRHKMRDIHPSPTVLEVKFRGYSLSAHPSDM